MATLAHSYTIERPAFHRPRPRSVERIAIDRIGARQLALAECVAAFLDTAYEGEWEWEASDNFFGTPVDSAVITGKTPNGDGTHSGIIMVGDMDLLGPLLRAIGMERQRPKSFAEALLERVHWLDDFWGPLPLPYHLTQWIEENEMALSNQDKLDIKAMIAEGVAEGLKDYSIPVGKISFSTGQVVAIVSVIFAGVIAVGGAIIGGSIYVHHGLGKVEAEVAALSVKVDERLPVKQPPTSTDTRSSKPPTARDDPSKP